VIWIERFAMLVETLGLAVREARLLPMAPGTQALQLARNEGIPIATMLDDVINLNRGCNAPSVLADPAQRLTLQLLAPDGMPNRHRVPRAPVAPMRIGTRTSHRKGFIT
jgi:hypothetical protein